jgi:hypothetical protein
MSREGAPPGRDAAWVVIETAAGAAELAAFCRDLERLYRINPFLEFKSWRQSAADLFTARWVNHSNRQEVALEGRVTRASDLEFRVDFAAGLKRNTRFEIRPGPRGASLTITDEYGPTGGGVPVEAEIDRSLHAWGVALRAYLERDRRWGWVPLYRPCLRRLWLPMSPSARRIAFLILVIGLADALLIALGFAIYWLEAGH